jgi:hypothetical protein
LEFSASQDADIFDTEAQYVAGIQDARASKSPRAWRGARTSA